MTTASNGDAAKTQRRTGGDDGISPAPGDGYGRIAAQRRQDPRLVEDVPQFFKVDPKLVPTLQKLIPDSSDQLGVVPQLIRLTNVRTMINHAATKPFNLRTQSGTTITQKLPQISKQQFSKYISHEQIHTAYSLLQCRLTYNSRYTIYNGLERKILERQTYRLQRPQGF